MTMQLKPSHYVQPGMSIPYRGGAVPYGYLLEDASAVSRTTYARLFGIIGTTYGAGDGVNTFNLPDSRGRADIGSGTGPGLSARSLGQTGGEENHVLSNAEAPPLTHGHSLNLALDNAGTTYNAAANWITNSLGNPESVSNTQLGSGGAHNNMQPYLVATRMVKF